MTPDNHSNLYDILNAMEDGIYITREDHTVEFMNDAMVRQFGPGLGKPCYQVVNQSEVMCPWCRAKEVFEDGMGVHSEVYIPRQNKTYRIIEVPIKNLDGSISKLNIYRDITRRKDQELQLRATEQDYRRLFEHVAAGVYTSSKEGRFLNANHALLEMLGYSDKDEFLNMSIQRDLYVRPEDRIAFQQMIEDDGHVVNYPVEFKRKDGSTIPVLLTAHTRTNPAGQVVGYEGICVDQTQIVRMQRKIEEGRDFLNNIIQSSPNAIIGADMQGRVIIWNKGAEETLGYTADELMGEDVRQLYSEGMAYELMRMMRSPEYGGKGKLRGYPLTFMHKDGRAVEGTMSASIIYDKDGGETASVGFFVDLGERLAMERQLSRTQEQLLQSEKLAAMGRLTSQLAHELNNPLYGIMNTLELMKTEIRPDNKRRRLLDMALSETVRLADMLRKMLSFSKPDQEERRPVDINTIVDEIMLLHEKQLREVDIKLQVSLGEGLRPVSASKNQLRQVMLNMVSNAKDAMPQGGRLTVTTSGNGGHVRVEIGDTGSGIRPEHLDKIFDTFFTTKTESARGVGLGLSVCYGFVKDHGGDIQVESKVGVGTTFKIILPVVQGDVELPKTADNAPTA
ncbi:PAS domain-containing sensor histidine kinase [Desulfatitalea alkaliphila]|uniref:histidine kinase n=1 Tax=Desulfatitalea alkaliphila TaxID=2929485 RepID=A0AA41QZV5_9BACT|nr:PAS domain S-box protein [Desulfatitalea alkaliphila]MCJ8500207.1 PAS domain S-box protein [Desulfatitalea alkaliphila]